MNAGNTFTWIARWVGEEALAIALVAAFSGQDYVDVIGIAANHDRPSDSTPSFAGHLWEAWHGIEGNPRDWICRLDGLVPLLHLGRRLPDTRTA